MAKYNIGDKVSSIRTKVLGTIVEVYPRRPGRQLYEVAFENGETSTMLEANLIPEVNIDDPFECCARGIYGSNSDFTCINTSYKIRNTNNNTISSLKASKTIFKAYQFKPLLKFLNSRNRRVLIADEVGLGKTIEAGHIMLELHSRRELKNALIICPMSLSEKWQEELKDKFGFDFTRYDTDTIINDIKRRDGFIRGIINYEKIRFGSRIYKFIEECSFHFDLIVCDEAHKLRNHSTQIHKGVKLLLDSPCAALFLTATPVMISEENLFNLLALLDPEQYGNYAIFKNSLSINTPFISAISLVNNNASYSDIRQHLKEARASIYYSIGEDKAFEISQCLSIEHRFKDSPLYQRIIKELESGTDSTENRVRLQMDLSSLSPMNTIFSRTRRIEISTDDTQTQRHTYTRLITLHKNEQREFDSVIDNYDYDSKDIGLALLQSKRKISSSVYGSLNNEEDLKNGIDRYECYPDSKVDELLKIVEALKGDNLKHLIVFAIFKTTLRYLSIRLAKYGIKTIRIDGDVKSEDRFKLIQKFKDAEEFTILLSSEVGSEGLDMQFCNAIVNYDLPWNPMVVEQRIGRIARFGQKSEVVHIYNLIVQNSIQVTIFECLLERIEVFTKCIGDLEVILDEEIEHNNKRYDNIQAFISSLEQDIYVNKRTKSEIEDMLNSIASALITEKEHLNEVSRGLTNTLTNDLYFKQKIESIDKLNKYVSETDLHNFVSLLREKRFPSCDLYKHPKIDDAYILTIPQSEPKILINFLDEYYPTGLGEDLELLNKQFKSRIRGLTRIALTFNQKVAYEHKETLEFINAYHPLITSAYLYFDGISKKLSRTFNFSISKKLLGDDFSLEKGDYYMALYVLRVDKVMYGRTQKIELLTPVLYDLKNGKTIDDKAVSEVVYAKAQKVSSISYISDTVLSKDEIINMKYELTCRIDSIRDDFFKDQAILLDSYKDMQTKHYEDFYKYHIQHLNDIYERHIHEVSYGKTEEERTKYKQVLSLDRSKIQKAEETRDNAMKAIQELKIIEKEPQLISISHITIS